MLTNKDHSPRREEKQDYSTENNAAPGGRPRPPCSGLPSHGSSQEAGYSWDPSLAGPHPPEGSSRLRMFTYIPSQNRYLISWALTFLLF